MARPGPTHTAPPRQAILVTLHLTRPGSTPVSILQWFGHTASSRRDHSTAFRDIIVNAAVGPVRKERPIMEHRAGPYDHIYQDDYVQAMDSIPL